MSKEEDIKYLMGEKDMLWKRLTELEALIANKTTENEAESKASADRAKANKEESEASKAQVNQRLTEANVTAGEIAEVKKIVLGYQNEIETLKREIAQLKIDADKYIKEFGDYKVGELKTSKESIDKIILDTTNTLAQLETKQKLFEGLYNSAFEGTTTEPSYQSQFKSAVNQMTKDMADAQDQLSQLKAFYDKVVDKEEKNGKKTVGLETQVGNR